MYCFALIVVFATTNDEMGLCAMTLLVFCEY
uniref:Uncharacterized protein n=1 Tax=Arundo donax TaxID=35708 RepID=A0A0A8YRF4_ARUDO